MIENSVFSFSYSFVMNLW